VTVATSTPKTADFTSSPSEPSTGSQLYWAISDVLMITKRNLIRFKRTPDALFFSTVQPIMFVLLFRYVFGGAVKLGGTLPTGARLPYVDFLMAGIFAQSISFGGIGTAVGLAEDLQTGLVERFRALPMVRFAVLAGRTIADLIRNVLVIVVMTAMGALVGFNFPTGGLAFIAAVALWLVFAYALLWCFAVIGLSASNSETAQVIAFPILFPLLFASPAFVPVYDMPGWLQGFVTHQPLGVLIDASRALMVGGPTASLVGQSLAWTAGIFVVFMPIAVWRYRERS
jgi:ABC-2 type transport system permease protein/oleandomycin transport system permease protein